MPARRALAVLAVAVAGPVLAAPALGEGGDDMRLRAGNTKLRLDPAAAEALASLGITAQPISTARTTRRGAVRFPITSGRADADRQGQIRHNGGLRLRTGDASVDLNNLRVEFDDSPDLTAQIGSGDRVSIADLDASGAGIGMYETLLVLSGVVARISGEGAAALNEAFGTTAFREIAPLGRATITGKARRPR